MISDQDKIKIHEGIETAAKLIKELAELQTMPMQGCKDIAHNEMWKLIVDKMHVIRMCNNHLKLDIKVNNG